MWGGGLVESGVGAHPHDPSGPHAPSGHTLYQCAHQAHRQTHNPKDIHPKGSSFCGRSQPFDGQRSPPAASSTSRSRTPPHTAVPAGATPARTRHRTTGPAQQAPRLLRHPTRIAASPATACTLRSFPPLVAPAARAHGCPTAPTVQPRPCPAAPPMAPWSHSSPLTGFTADISLRRLPAGAMTQPACPFPFPLPIPLPFPLTTQQDAWETEGAITHGTERGKAASPRHARSTNCSKARPSPPSRRSLHEW